MNVKFFVTNFFTFYRNFDEFGIEFQIVEISENYQILIIIICSDCQGNSESPIINKSLLVFMAKTLIIPVWILRKYCISKKKKFFLLKKLIILLLRLFYNHFKIFFLFCKELYPNLIKLIWVNFFKKFN